MLSSKVHDMEGKAHPDEELMSWVSHEFQGTLSWLHPGTNLHEVPSDQDEYLLL